MITKRYKLCKSIKTVPHFSGNNNGVTPHIPAPIGIWLSIFKRQRCRLETCVPVFLSRIMYRHRTHTTLLSVFTTVHPSREACQTVFKSQGHKVFTAYPYTNEKRALRVVKAPTTLQHPAPGLPPSTPAATARSGQRGGAADKTAEKGSMGAFSENRDRQRADKHNTTQTPRGFHLLSWIH